MTWILVWLVVYQFYLRHQILQNRVGHVADEEITLAVLSGQKLFIPDSGF